MTTIHIAASREYDVVIEPGLLTRLGTMAAELGLGRRAAVISDDAVFALYGAAAEKALTDAGFQVDHFLFPHGEQQKNLSTYGQVLNFLCDRRFTRSDFLVALGGGVVGDLAGFAAATYQRGIPYIQVPTTLLSMVDSSVGGKTAVDLDHGKNQAGCFYQPSLVLCDPSLLNTLPEREYRAGCAEIIKYAMLYSEDFLRELEKTPVREQFERVIGHFFDIKDETIRAMADNSGSYGGYFILGAQPGFYTATTVHLPEPEITDYWYNSDGTLTMKIDAVYPWYGTDCAFTHELTVEETKNGFIYVSNYVYESTDNIFPDLALKREREAEIATLGE